MPRKALILVDIQNDFCPGGVLAVKDGHKVVPIANRLMPAFDLVIATQDWHPANHQSFAANNLGMNVGDMIELAGQRQILRPVHCVQATHGAALVAGLDASRIEKIFQKGTDPAIDSYSGFFDNGHLKSTGLTEYLKAEGGTDIYIMGLTTDYCVKFTALDGIDQGFKTYLIEDACRGAELKPGDIAWAVEEMKNAGVETVLSKDVARS